MKIAIIILSLITGGFMLIDGIHVIVKGKYIGPEKPGPWANLFSWFNADVYKLGPLFVIYGLLWMTFIFGFSLNQNWSYLFGILVCALTLWYIPVGTLLSIVVMLLLILGKNKWGW